MTRVIVHASSAPTREWAAAHGWREMEDPRCPPGVVYLMSEQQYSAMQAQRVAHLN